MGVLVLAAAACGASGDAYEALPDGVLLLVREPTGDEPAEAQLYEPFEARIQVDPRVPTTNCALQVSLSVGDESGAYRELRSLTFAAPLVGDVVRAAFEFSMDPTLGSTTKEQGADVPFDVPVWGTYFAQVSARLVPPAADDPTVALSSLERCLETLAVATADDPSLKTDAYFELTIPDEEEPVETDAPDSATTEPEDTTDSASSTSTSTIASPVSTIRPPSSTIRTTTTIRAATTTVAPRPSVSIGNDMVQEGDSASTTAQLTVSLSAPSSSLVTVNYTTADGTATTADADYTAKSGSVSIPAGQTTATISVSVIGDTTVEPTELFSVNLTSAVGANLLDSSGTVTISNDDTAPLPSLSISNNSVAEGDAGSTTVTVTVTLSAASASTVTVGYSTGGGTASAGVDYSAESGTVTFLAGDTSQNITLTVLGDLEVEGNETFTVVLSGASGATIADSTATVTIIDDDVAAGAAMMTTIRPGGLYLR